MPRRRPRRSSPALASLPSPQAAVPRRFEPCALQVVRRLSSGRRTPVSLRARVPPARPLPWHCPPSPSPSVGTRSTAGDALRRPRLHDAQARGDESAIAGRQTGTDLGLRLEGVGARLRPRRRVRRSLSPPPRRLLRGHRHRVRRGDRRLLPRGLSGAETLSADRFYQGRKQAGGRPRATTANVRRSCAACGSCVAVGGAASLLRCRGCGRRTVPCRGGRLPSSSGSCACRPAAEEEDTPPILSPWDSVG